MKNFNGKFTAFLQKALVQLLFIVVLAALVGGGGVFIAYGKFVKSVFATYLLWLTLVFAVARTLLALADLIRSMKSSPKTRKGI